jgi:dihydrodipicolinate synthase/N-acetylneuraminate lyase
MIVTAAFSGIETVGLEVLRILVESEPRIAALKDDICGDFAKRVATLCHPAWAIISGGQKQNHLDLFPYGCDGYMSTFIHFNPPIAHRYWDLVVGGDLATAAALINRYDRPYFDRILAMPGGFDGGFHATLEAAGLAGRWRRQPYHSLTDAEYAAFVGFLQDGGMLEPPSI